MKSGLFALVVLISLVAGAVGGRLAAPRMVTAVASSPQAASASSEPAYERVMRTGTLRCGYLLWPPLLTKDPNSGQFKGPWYDIVTEMGKRLGLKIEWTEEVGTATMFEGFRTGRYDALCAPLTSTPERARSADFTIPFAYIPYTLYVRKDDKRFDGNFAAADDPSVRVVTIDGEYSSKIAAEDLPGARAVSLQNMTQGSELLLYVENGKADVAPDDMVSATDFMAAHGNTIRPVAGPPLRTLPLVLPLPKGEYELKQMLDVTLTEMLDTGFTQKTFENSTSHPGTYLFPALVQQPK